MSDRARMVAGRRQQAGTRLRTRGGFTLVELLMVLVLGGILMGIATPRIDFRRARVDSSVLRLSSRLLVSQRQAVVRQHDVRVSFEVGGSRIRVHQDADNDGSVDPGEEVIHFQLGEGTAFGRGGASPLDGAPSSPPVTFAENPASGHPEVAFHRNGSASEEGVVYLTTDPAGGPELARAVRLRRATGQTECWTHREGTWKEPC